MIPRPASPAPSPARARRAAAWLTCAALAAGGASGWAAQAAGTAPHAAGTALHAAPRRAGSAAPLESLGPGERRFEDGDPFGTVTLYAPARRPRAVVIFLSGDGGWHLGVISMARHLRDWGAAVAGVDVRSYLASIANSSHPGCRYMAADLETLAHRVERELGMSDYVQPLLYGYSSGATIVYAALVQSPPGTFGAAVSMGFCPDQKFGGVPLCPGVGATLRYHPGDKGAWVFDPAPTLSDRWVAFQGQIDAVCSADAVSVFAAKVGASRLVSLPHVGHGFGVDRNWLPQFQQVFDQLATATDRAPGTGTSGAGVGTATGTGSGIAAGAGVAAATGSVAGSAVGSATDSVAGAGLTGPVPAVADLPLVELPAGADPATPLAILLTGDGGWAGIDRGVAQALNERGVPVVALSSLRYFWHERTPEQSAGDVARIMRHYLAVWGRRRVLLVGYSFGADVLPFIVNRLPADLRARIVTVNLLGLSGAADFVIHVSGWVPEHPTGTLPLRPELARMQGVRALCLYGAGESHDPCPRLAGGALAAESLGSGHHFGGEYAALAAAMLAHAGSAADGGATRQ